MTATATIIDGKAVAARVRAEVAEEVARMDSAPGLATVLVGDDPASQIYVGGKHKACAEVGIASIRHDLPPDTSEADVLDVVAQLNDDPAVSGIIVQLPVPGHIDAARVTSAVDPAKDVDGLTPTNAGLLVQGRDGLVPATPSGVMELLREYDTPLEGAHAVVVGRSDLVGKPVAALLLARNATVTMCHSRTRDLGEVCRSADVLVAAVGRPQLITGDMVKEGATVIDVGMNRTADGLVGDVEFETAAARARAITPVPGGVGPMTIAMLLRNTLKAAGGVRRM
ncbi:MAG TPA: bifunctional methylenetetrahydrofolate dehydrogenase/methenyltetrahydrofolate cyclohydrolase FolD [Solirubrobacterales bacterium]|nr:bifunctional methylenetetrahydrofolate dehydrogenase/methenyltetrahydrofolate cyclohydrolase FolD [Solirubrobacterales bacterium]